MRTRADPEQPVRQLPGLPWSLLERSVEVSAELPPAVVEAALRSAMRELSSGLRYVRITLYTARPRAPAPVGFLLVLGLPAAPRSPGTSRARRRATAR